MSFEYRYSKYTEEIAAEMVAAGGKWVDAHQNRDWPYRIDPSTLDIANGEVCVFGQLYRADAAECGCRDGWDWPISHGLINWENTYELGLSVKSESPYFGHNVALLNDAWRKLIADRRAELIPA